MKYYFEHADGDDNCFTKDHFMEVMDELGITEMEVFPAKVIYGEEYFWCHAIGEPGMKGEGCGRFCSDYKPRNGKNGRCVHSGHCYEPADESIILKLKKK